MVTSKDTELPAAEFLVWACGVCMCVFGVDARAADALGIGDLAIDPCINGDPVIHWFLVGAAAARTVADPPSPASSASEIHPRRGLTQPQKVYTEGPQS